MCYFEELDGDREFSVSHERIWRLGLYFIDLTVEDKDFLDLSSILSSVLYRYPYESTVFQNI